MGVREPGLTVGEAADILGVDAAWVTARIDGGELRGTHHHGSHPSRPMPERHRISEQELRSSSWGTPMGWTAATSTCPDSSVSWRSGTGREAKTRAAAMGQRGRTRGFPAAGFRAERFLSVPRRLALDPAPKPCLKRLPATAPGIAVFPAAGGLSNTPRSQAQLMSVSLRGDCNRAQAPQGLEGCHAQLM